MLGNTGLSIFGNTQTEDTLKALAGMGVGRTYYVNNITGASGNDGLSWNSAFDEISTAITASEVYRVLQTANNRYIRNTIMVQGTATAYTSLTDLGEHINIIGLGDNMLGNASGIVRIGPDSGAEVYGLLTTETVRGLYLYNLQFQGGANADILRVTNIFRTTFEYCGFFTNGNPVTAPDFGFRVIGAAGGLHLKDCHWGNASGVGAGPRTGLSLEGSHFHICLVEGCHITGSTAAVNIASECVNTWGSVMRNCYMGADSSTDCAIGIDDNVSIGHIRYLNCFLDATDPIEVTNDATRFIGCIAQNAFVST